MDDLISRQALCEYALNQKDKSITPNDIMRFPSAQPETCAYWDRESNICALHRPSAQRWIPVTPKTLPKEVGDYIVMTHGGSVTKLLFMGNAEYWMRWAVAWMPLPEPYRPEGEEHG